MLVLSDLRSLDIGRGQREKPNDWLGPQNGNGAPFPSAEVNRKKGVFEQGSWQTNHSHFTPGWRQKINWDMKDSKSFKPVLKTEQSLLARERRTILQWNPVENKISNFGDIFPLYPNFVYHSLSLSIRRRIRAKKRHLYSWTVQLYVLTLWTCIYK